MAGLRVLRVERCFLQKFKSSRTSGSIRKRTKQTLCGPGSDA